jgi:predicted SnoaL-like aldol condensation-catalyzing enzyme
LKPGRSSARAQRALSHFARNDYWQMTEHRTDEHWDSYFSATDTNDSINDSKNVGGRLRGKRKNFF